MPSWPTMNRWERTIHVFMIVILTVLVLLAVSSGVAKILLMVQEVAFFGAYGFTNAMIIAFGATQLIGGFLLVFHKSRLIGAALVGITFAISAILLVMDGNFPLAVITVAMMVLLFWVVKESVTSLREAICKACEHMRNIRRGIENDETT